MVHEMSESAVSSARERRELCLTKCICTEMFNAKCITLRNEICSEEANNRENAEVNGDFSTKF